MDHYRAWKSYARDVDSAISLAGYADAEFSVHRTDARGGAGARWSWICGSPLLAGQEWPDGLALEWNPATGWGFGSPTAERLVPLPVPVLAAPQAITALLPALLDGRRAQLPTSRERWKHAGAVEAWVKASSPYGDTTNGPAEQPTDDEAQSFLRWQAEVDATLPDDVAHAAGQADGGEGAAGARQYRVVARRTGPAHPGAATLTHFARAASVEEAAALVRAAHEQPDGVYGADGLYRIVEVTEDSPESAAGRSEDPDTKERARRQHVNTVLDEALKASDKNGQRPHFGAVFDILTDYFTRAVVFPGQFDPDDEQLHTSTPSRALAYLLMEHLTRHGLGLDDAPVLEVPESSVAPVGDAMAEGIAQALLASCWFTSATATGTDGLSDHIAFTTAFGVDGVLHVTVAQDPSDSGNA
ncbi:hypothetical protein CTZ27_30140 [Streptomyces griseocarneus]|nr:hypothetical protein CTZ27_30140 [Streptomyces griseocarneus]